MTNPEAQQLPIAPLSRPVPADLDPASSLESCLLPAWPGSKLLIAVQQTSSLSVDAVAQASDWSTDNDISRRWWRHHVCVARRKNGHVSLPMKCLCFTTPLLTAPNPALPFFLSGVSTVTFLAHSITRPEYIRIVLCPVSSSLQTTFIHFPPRSFYCQAQTEIPLF